jgi:MoaA/NifB/PqqE/SkfB family radical SAM enzyme
MAALVTVQHNALSEIADSFIGSACGRVPDMEHVHFLQIEPTTRCNFICGFCAGRSMRQSDLLFSRLEHALHAFPELRHVELQGEGESLMHPRFLDMVELLRARGVRVSFITNGSYLTPETIGRLLDAGIEKISVSLESSDPAEFQRIRGGKLDKVLRGVEALLRERRVRKLDRPVIGFAVTVLRSTRDRLAAIIALYRRLGLDGGIVVQPLQRMPAYKKGYPAELLREELFDDEVEELQLRARRMLRTIEKQRAPVKGFYDELLAGWAPAQGRCPWLERGLFVNNEGDITACCMIKDTARYRLGRLGETSPAAVLAARADLREQLRHGKIPAACTGCNLAQQATLSRPAHLLRIVKGIPQRLRGLLGADSFGMGAPTRRRG